MQHPVIAHSSSDLEQMATPSAVPGNREAIATELYDTQVFTSAATTALTFFTAADVNNGFVTNMKQAGQIPTGDFFMPYWLGLDVLGFEPGDYDRLTDLYRLVYGTATGAPYAVLSYGTKTYPQAGGFSLARMAEGGITGFSTRTAEEYANIAHPGTGGVWLGADDQGNATLTFKGGQPFSWQMKWAAPVTLLAGGTVLLRLTMRGTYYRGIQ